MKLYVQIYNLLSLVCSIVTFFMCCLHVLLIFGVPIGEYVLGGKEKVIPLRKRWINGIFACIFYFLGVFYLGKAGIISFALPNRLSNGVMIGYTVFLAYAIIGNIFFTESKKEKIVMIPSSIICFICSFLTFLIIQGF